MSLLVDTGLSQPRRSCFSSKFLMKNNLIEKLLLPSASGLHRGHTQQHNAANKGYVHACALGNDKSGEDAAFFLSHYAVHTGFRPLLDIFRM